MTYEEKPYNMDLQAENIQNFGQAAKKHMGDIKNMFMETIAIDLGNITTIVETEKESYIFESRIREYSDIKGFDEAAEIFEYDGKKYIVNEGSFENELLKHEKENYIKILHYGLGKVATKTEVNLSLGIPAGQYKAYKEDLKKIVLENREINIKINDKSKKVYINDLMIYPEGAAAYRAIKERYNNLLVDGAKTLIIDIGGGTTDISEFDASGKFIDGKTIQHGLLNLYSYVQDELFNNYKLSTTLESAKEFFRDNEKSPAVQDQDFKIIPIEKSFKEILNEVKQYYKDLEHRNLVVIGGGAEVYGSEFKNIYSQTIIEKDIKINGVTYFGRGQAKWQKK